MYQSTLSLNWLSAVVNAQISGKNFYLDRNLLDVGTGSPTPYGSGSDVRQTSVDNEIYGSNVTAIVRGKIQHGGEIFYFAKRSQWNQRKEKIPRLIAILRLPSWQYKTGSIDKE